jgi:sulfur-oxidizing protein SoxA
VLAFVVGALTLAGVLHVEAASLPEPPIARAALKNGSEFTSEANRSLQADDFANPGMLWVSRGEALWRDSTAGNGKSCASCHGDSAASLKGAAPRYPRVDAAAGRLVNLSGRINVCRARNQAAKPFAAESEPLLALTAYVTHQSRGMPMAVSVDASNRAEFERGRSRYYTRMGQLNLACAQCHDRYWGRTMMIEKISQGHGTGFPAYRQEWQTVGSLQRRLRACYSALHAEMPEYDARELVELELFLAWRSNGLPIEAPAVRR